MFKGIINRSLVFALARSKQITLSREAKLSYRTIRNAGVGCRFLGQVIISSQVNIGRYTSINGPATRISACINEINIGSFCSIASSVVIQEYNHKFDRISSYYVNQNLFNGSYLDDITSTGPIIIEDDVWIGSNSVILSGITIGRGAIIGAGSIVTKDIPKYSIVAGNPAKVLKQRFTEETISALEESKWWEWSIARIRRERELFDQTEAEFCQNIYQKPD